MERKLNGWKIPEKAEGPYTVTIETREFWDRILLSCEYYEAHPKGIIDNNLKLSHRLLLGEDEFFGLRDRAGFEEKLDLNNEKFFQCIKNPRRTTDSIEKILITYPESSRDFYMEEANAMGITLKELGRRMLLVGLYVMERVREDGSSLITINNGERVFWNITVAHQKNFVRKRLKKLFDSQDALLEDQNLG